MKEVGIDILNSSKVIISTDRKKRPIDENMSNKDEVLNVYNESCPFCRGNEHLTAEETFIINDGDNWIVRSVKNKYPILDQDPINKIKGDHEVIIDTYKHNGNFYNMDEEEFYNLIIAYRNRYISLSTRETQYICLFKNYLRKAGASLMHPHSQIISLPFIPIELEKEYDTSREFYKKMGINMYSYIIKEEIKYGKRVIYDSDNFLVFIPEVSKYTGDTIILFKNNIYFEEISYEEIKELSIILKKYFSKLYTLEGNCPFNIYIHAHPINTEDDYKEIFNVHIHILPRKFNLGGFEMSTGVYISSISAEDIATKYKFK